MVKEYPDRTVMKRQIKIMNKELEDQRVVMRQRQIQSQMLVDALQRYEIERQAATAAATPVTSPSDKPNCLCGAPAQMLTVKKEGPQRGRKFWKCVQRQFEFFQWIGIDADTMSTISFSMIGSMPPSIQEPKKGAVPDPGEEDGGSDRGGQRWLNVKQRSGG